MNFHVILVDKKLDWVSKKRIKGLGKLQKVVDRKAKRVILFRCRVVENESIFIPQLARLR